MKRARRAAYDNGYDYKIFAFDIIEEGGPDTPTYLMGIWR